MDILAGLGLFSLLALFLGAFLSFVDMLMHNKKH